MTNRPALTYSVGSRTDKGMQRSANEDAVALLDVPGADAAFVVADGMGGLRAGDVASNEAVRVVRETLADRFAAADAWEDPFVPLSEAFTLANDAVNGLAKPAVPVSAPEEETRDSAAPVPGNALMGTTCVVGLVRETTLYLAHVGDSRAYLYREGALSRLTEDHSFVADRVRAGDMTETEARSSRFRNMITRAIGIEPTVAPDFRQERLLPGDAIILCSDGLTTMMDDDEIETMLGTRTVARLAPERAASALVDAANKKGGSDNITVVLLRAHEPGQETAIAAPTSPPAASPAKSALSPPPARKDIPAEMPLRRSASPRGASPLLGLFALLGALSVVAAGALAASPELRDRLAGLLSAKTARAGGMPVDFTNLGYTAPEKFAANLLARGDMLSYSRGTGLFFVADTSGKVAYLSQAGEAVKSVATLAPKGTTSIPDTQVFMTTDPHGNVYLSYTRRKVIEKKTPEGKLLLTLSGFEQPEAITLDEQGNLYVVDFNQIKVLKAKPNSLAAQKRTAPAAKPAAKKPGK
ncbi:MAG: protein phosphatase 2C domain-containing protein [Cytophagales bacterium]|nr:protein phosphatase 2C domain-containing protein [Armatimonadota bacterium]